MFYRGATAAFRYDCRHFRLMPLSTLMPLTMMLMLLSAAPTPHFHYFAYAAGVIAFR